MKLIGSIKRHYPKILFALAGALAGFLYWKFIGCNSGTCPLTSNWHTTTLFGGLIGMLAVPGRKNNTDNKTKPE